MTIGLTDEQLDHLRTVTREVPHWMRDDFVARVFDRLRDRDGTITMRDLADSVSATIRAFGLR
jgi:hypothetical protein